MPLDLFYLGYHGLHNANVDWKHLNFHQANNLTFNNIISGMNHITVQMTIQGLITTSVINYNPLAITGIIIGITTVPAAVA